MNCPSCKKKMKLTGADNYSCECGTSVSVDWGSHYALSYTPPNQKTEKYQTLMGEPIGYELGA